MMPQRLGRDALSVAPVQFRNGWFCKICDRVTEHKEVKGRQVCLECGYKMGQERPDVKAKKKEKQRQRRIEQLEKKLQALRMEAVV